MTHFEVGIKLQHDCPVNAFSKKNPSVILAWWCNVEFDVLEITHWNPDDFQSMVEDLDGMIREIGGQELHRSWTDSKLQVLTKCSCMNSENNTSRMFGRNMCLELYPAIFTEGWEWYRVVAFEENNLKALFSDLDKRCLVEVVSKRVVDQESVRDTQMISTSNLLGNLTSNQTEALLLALDSGYYSVPKRITTLDVAARLGIPRTTFEDRLRRAESKVLQSVAPYVLFSRRKQRRVRSSSERKQVAFPSRAAPVERLLLKSALGVDRSMDKGPLAGPDTRPSRLAGDPLGGPDPAVRAGLIRDRSGRRSV